MEALYPRLLGPEWEKLPPAVRRMHLQHGGLIQAGSFRVQHGRSALARLMLLLLRLPAAGDAVVTELRVTPTGDSERWLRRFNGRPLLTIQSEGPGRVLCDRVGPFELWFQLTACGPALVYRQVGAALRLCRLRVRLPGWLQPRVEAQERAVGMNCICASITVALPTGSRLISYDGCLYEEQSG